MSILESRGPKRALMRLASFLSIEPQRCRLPLCTVPLWIVPVIVTVPAASSDCTRDPAVDNLHQHDLVPWRSTELPPTRHSPAMRGVRQRILTPWASAELSRVRLRPPVSHDEASTPLLPVVSPPSKVVPLPSWTPKMEPYMPPAQEPQTETELQPQRSLREVAHGPSEIQEVHASHEHHRLMDSPSSLPSSSFDHHSPLSQTSSPEFAQQSYWSRPVKAGSMHVRLERPPLDVLQPVPSLELSSTSSKGAEPEEWHNPFVASGVTLDYPPSKLNIYIADDGSRDPATRCGVGVGVGVCQGA
eukprot:104362-Pelagomonas_calceolata.AAC.6